MSENPSDRSWTVGLRWQQSEPNEDNVILLNREVERLGRLALGLLVSGSKGDASGLTNGLHVNWEYDTEKDFIDINIQLFLDSPEGDIDSPIRHLDDHECKNTEEYLDFLGQYLPGDSE